jgi:general stress protein 26
LIHQGDKKPRFDPIKLETVQIATDYPMEAEEFDVLYVNNCYCEMAHNNKNGYPIVTPMFYVIMDDGLVYMSSVQKYRKKVYDLETNPKISVTIHNDGARANKQKAILIMGTAEVSREPELMERVHWKIVDKYHQELEDEDARQAAFNAMHTPNRVVIRVVPEKVMSWDFGKMVNSYQKGVWFNESYQMIKHFTEN